MPEKRRPMTRSEMMSRIGPKDTAPELLVRRGLYAKRVGFKLHRKELPGKPDLVLSKYNAVIFVHGCFWHAHKGCKLFQSPATRTHFWEPKLRRNRERDEEVKSLLVESGWRVLTVWECATRSLPVEELIEKIVQWLKSSSISAELSAP